MREKLEEIQAAYDRLEMQTEVLMSVIERTQNFREGFYALRVMADHAKTLNRGAFAYGATSPEEAMEQMLLQITNMAATVATQIERLDR